MLVKAAFQGSEFLHPQPHAKLTECVFEELASHLETKSKPMSTTRGLAQGDSRRQCSKYSDFVLYHGAKSFTC
jgi:hypothetical protein